MRSDELERLGAKDSFVFFFLFFSFLRRLDLA